MYWSGFDADTNRKMVARAGFTLLEADVIDEEEDGRIVPFVWILARKGGSGRNVVQGGETKLEASASADLRGKEGTRDN